MARKLMILGGAKAQVPLIEAAKKEGYYVVLVDYTDSNPGILLADKHYQVDYTERDKVLQIARNEAISGVISNSEFAMLVVAFVSEQLGLVGNKVDSVISVGTKAGFRKLQKKIGFFAPKFFASDSYDKVKRVLKTKDLQFPIVMKPSRSSGSRGTTIFETEELLEKYGEKIWCDCSSYSIDNRVIVEEYCENVHRNVVIEGEIFIHRGDFIWNGLFTSKHSDAVPKLPATQIYPIVIDKEQYVEVKNYITKVFNEAGITHGEYNVELFYTTKNDLFGIEINVRQGGNGAPEMVQKHCGINMYKLLVTTCMGDDYYWNDVCTRNVEGKYVSKHGVYSGVAGLFKGLYIDSDIKEFVTDISLIVGEGSYIDKSKMASDVIAFVTLEFPSREVQLKYVETIEKYIYPKVIV